MLRTTRRAAAGVLVAIACQFTTAACDPPGMLTAAQLLRLRTCESSNNYRAVSPSGTYRGAYQFDRTTWRTMGGSGDPAAAHPWEQDLRARLLHRARGTTPWPRCGRLL